MSTLKERDRAIPKIHWQAVALVAMLLLTNYCALPKQPDPGGPRLQPSDPAFSNNLQIHYLGGGGYLLQQGDVAIAISPIYSAPKLKTLFKGSIEPDTMLIDTLYRRLPHATVYAVLIGHSHYDHLLDAPHITRKFHSGAKIWGSEAVATLTKLCEPDLEKRIEILEGDRVSRGGEPVEWQSVAGGRIRFMAIETEHNNHIPWIRVMRGDLKPMTECPDSAFDWKEGKTLAYLIDFMAADLKTINHRVYYSDVTPKWKIGLPPVMKAQDQHPVNLALLTVGLFGVAPGYPWFFMKVVKPQEVIGGHWEDIFKNPAEGTRRLFLSNPWKFNRIVSHRMPANNEWKLGKRGAIYQLTPAPPIP